MKKLKILVRSGKMFLLPPNSYLLSPEFDIILTEII